MSLVPLLLLQIAVTLASLVALVLLLHRLRDEQTPRLMPLRLLGLLVERLQARQRAAIGRLAARSQAEKVVLGLVTTLSLMVLLLLLFLVRQLTPAPLPTPTATDLATASTEGSANAARELRRPPPPAQAPPPDASVAADLGADLAQGVSPAPDLERVDREQWEKMVRRAVDFNNTRLTLLTRRAKAADERRSQVIRQCRSPNLTQYTAIENAGRQHRMKLDQAAEEMRALVPMLSRMMNKPRREYDQQSERLNIVREQAFRAADKVDECNRQLERLCRPNTIPSPF